ncbi:hypothetical protein G9A89_000844 [Geosiphon pyriformis]|nr:hypothetical protein G9A89_000844 [Geosiphon pyriformis]
MMEAPERAIFTAAFASLPLVVWLILLLAGHRDAFDGPTLCPALSWDDSNGILSAEEEASEKIKIMPFQ